MAQKQEGHKIVNFWMTDEDLERLDVITENVGYHNRADTIRTLIRLKFESLSGVVKKQGTGSPSSCSSATEA